MVEMNDNHEYWDGDRRYLGVSEVLHLAGIVSLGHIPPPVLEKARARGSDVHLACEDLDKGKPDWWTGTEAAPYVKAYAQWKRVSEFHVELIEHVVTDSIHGYAGTLDRTGTIIAGKKHPTPCLIDLKTSTQIYPWTALQLAAYNLTFPDAHVRKRMAIQLKKDGSYSVHVFEQTVDDNMTWFAALRVAKWRLKHGS